jgi:hypothetical protein
MKKFLSHLLEPTALDQKAGTRRVTATAMMMAATGIALLLYSSFIRRPKAANSIFELFLSLHSAFETGGISAFERQKALLKTQLSEQFKDPDRTPSSSLNIATYLFPDLLPEDNFERAMARELWEPLENAIEASPQSAESRQKFEELRATLWNYENPSHTSPELSSVAREIIRIYDVLSGT